MSIECAGKSIRTFISGCFEYRCSPLYDLRMFISTIMQKIGLNICYPYKGDRILFQFWRNFMYFFYNGSLIRKPVK